MKGKLWTTIFILVVALAAFAGPVQATSNGSIIKCTGTEHLIAFLYPGEWKTIDNHIRVRGMSMQYLEQATCPQASGVNTVVINANWDENQVGPIWGTSHNETDYAGGGIWEGTWHGKTNPDGSSSYSAVNHGVSGSVKGLIMWANAYTSPGGITQLSFTIREPGAN